MLRAVATPSSTTGTNPASGRLPRYGALVGWAVVAGEVDRGIVICGSWVGISIAANKVRGVRCVCCSEPYSALLSRRHNDTNVLAFGSRVVGEDLARTIVDCWLDGEYEGGRHAVRVWQLAGIEGSGPGPAAG